MVAFVLLAGFVSTLKRHAASPDIDSATRRSLMVGGSFGTFFGVALLIFYFIRAPWYWPPLLFFVGSTVAGLGFGLLDRALPPRLLGTVSLLGWPVVAFWAFYVVAYLPK
ncbi:MAG: hypothetical protein M5U13_16480 [Thermoanaerobaculia bacterium]|nr:hypothetical protein [Thermoanaerobaculia bacterium]